LYIVAGLIADGRYEKEVDERASLEAKKTMTVGRARIVRLRLRWNKNAAWYRDRDIICIEIKQKQKQEMARYKTTFEHQAEGLEMVVTQRRGRRR
jgi:hypothetical protein